MADFGDEFAEVEVFEIRQDRRNEVAVVLLKDVASDLFLPIWIGELEAVSMEIALTRRTPPRPMTHDLLKSVISELGGDLVRVEIDRLVDQTYFASLIISQGEEEISIDCRPSDGINLAIRMGRPILAHRSLLQELHPSGREEEAEPEELDEGDFREFLKRISPSDFES